MKNIILLINCAVFLVSCSVTQVDTIVKNGKIYTVNEKFSVEEAMAVANGKIVAVGNNNSINKKFKATETIDAKGNAVYPGFIDAHAHFVGYATDKWKLNIIGTKSFDEILSKLQDYSKTSSMPWLFARGWDQNDWQVKEFPDNEKLSELFPNTPVYLKRIDGHAALANKEALRIAGITSSTKIEGGEVELENGEPTGILIDNAMGMVEQKIPSISTDLIKQYITEGQNDCFKYGLTGIHDAGLDNRTVELLDTLHRNGALKMKIYVMLEDSEENYNIWLKRGVYKTDFLNVRGFKVYADGALGSRGACLLHDYSDKPNWKGFLLSDSNHFKRVAERLAPTDFQMCTHAIGDSANRFLLKVYNQYLGRENNKRWRIEHAQVVNESDFSLFADGNIVPSIQPTHGTSDMYWAATRLGKERVKNAYAYKRLLHQNGWVALGTDFPVEDINTFKTFLASVGRVDSEMYPNGGWQMENSLTREETLRGMTIWAAKAGFEEKEKGSLEKGKWADFIILDRDLMKVPVDQILSTKVVSTYVNGKKVYSISE